jgi:MFS family permease
MKPTAPVRQNGEPVEVAKPVSLVKSYYVLILLTLVWSAAYIDRNIINVVLEPIKKEFGVSDTLMGFMVGFGFVLIYAILAMPVARLADRKGRLPIICIGVTFWSIMTSFGAAAQTVYQLLFTRIGVGVGESAASAPGNSLISDYFPKDKRPMAMAILSMSPFIGVYGGFMIGGIAATYWGWRSAFLVAGIPGIIVAILLRFTVKEPLRGALDGKNADTRVYSLRETLRYFVSNKTYLLAVIGFSLTSFVDFGITAWFASFLMRVHHLTILQASTVGGTIKSLAGVTGVLLGGFVVSYLGKKSDTYKILTPGITSLLAGPFLAVFYFAPMPLAWFGLVAGVICTGFRMGPVLGLVQSVVKVRMRAFAAAVIFMIGNLFGYGLGPLFIGMSNDYLKPTYGPLAIRYSLISMPIMTMVGALFFLWAARYVKRDIQKCAIEE